MFSRRLFLPLVALSALGLFTACGDTSPKNEPVVVKTANERFAIKVGERVLHLQVVAGDEEMQQGLMYRQSMGAEEGMLFVYPAPQKMGFWMRNTEIALDIGYFDPTGELKEIYQMYPRDERPVTSHGSSLQFALEMNQDWYKQAGVRSGARLDLKAVAEALKSRGYKPASFGLR